MHFRQLIWFRERPIPAEAVFIRVLRRGLGLVPLFAKRAIEASNAKLMVVFGDSLSSPECCFVGCTLAMINFESSFFFVGLVGSFH